VIAKSSNYQETIKSLQDASKDGLSNKELLLRKKACETLAFGSDHVGLNYKNELMDLAKKLEYHVIDHGTFDSKRMDYPEIAFKVANEVSKGNADKGILVCGTGVGMSIAANKVSNIRAVVCSEEYSAAMSRGHNDTNVLCLGERVINLEVAKAILELWLNTNFESGRHQKRVEMIDNSLAHL
tara:strand:+ start:21 stop:569 length:549 start_codon:yes stop_codon:yes gene_type:complete